jgi:DNA-binding cell septation regulator SpoVG
VRGPTAQGRRSAASDQPGQENKEMSMSNDQPLVAMRMINKGQLKALVDVTLQSPLGRFTIRSFRIVQDDGKSPWVGFPSSTYTIDGKPVTRLLLRLPPALRRKIIQSVLAAFNRATANRIELPGASKESAPGRGTRLQRRLRWGGTLHPAGAPQRPFMQGGPGGTPPGGAGAEPPR